MRSKKRQATCPRPKLLTDIQLNVFESEILNEFVEFIDVIFPGMEFQRYSPTAPTYPASYSKIDVLELFHYKLLSTWSVKPAAHESNLLS
jgi:hypothetical protein